ncbi:MAG: hypothetical protein L3J05_04300 [Robiginitomaculum sp.]|nr:hypothetical protein [Robiginitomaculum sp.]
MKFGKDLIFLELEKPGYSGGSLSYSRSITYNVGIYSLVTSQTNWIFPTNNQEIRTTKHFRKTETLQNGDTKNTVIGHLFSSLTTGKDGEIHRDIWVTDINGNDRREILTDVDDEPEIWYYGDNKAKLIFETDKRVQLVDFDLFTRKIGETIIIAPPK